MQIAKVSAVVLIVMASTCYCPAFDTGHHADLTHAALANARFSKHGIQAVQVLNWLTDKFSAPDPPHVTKSEFDKLHFDNLYSTADIDNYWKQFAINTQSAAQAAAKEDDQVKFLAVMGLSLHAVQDFYTHSNWAETHPKSPGAPYRTNTWWNSPVDAGTKIYTGWYKTDQFPQQPAGIRPHGGYYDQEGLNHDAYQRPNWDQAYVFAHAACCEWVAAVCKWADEAKPGFVDRVRAYEVSGRGLEELNVDLAGAYRISEWISAGFANKNIDGHWKGPGSGRIRMFPEGLATWKFKPDSVYVKALKVQKVQLLLTKNLYGGAPQGSVPVIGPVPVDSHVAVLVRTLAVKDLSRSPLKVPNFYAKVGLNGGGTDQTYIEAMQNKFSKSITPAWRTMHFVDASQLAGGERVKVRYELYNEGNDTGFPLPQPGDKPYHIKPGDNEGKFLQFTFDVNSQSCQGDVNGVHDSEASAVASQGNNGDKAEIKIFVTSAKLGKPRS